MRKILIVLASTAALASAPLASANAAGGFVTGAAGGAITGAIIAGPVGAAVGGAVGLVAGGVLDNELAVGATVSPSAELHPMAGGYAYTWIDGHRVVVDPQTHVIISIDR